MELVLSQVSKSFKDKEAVKEINCVLHEGIHALLGANGSGKTTLLRIIVGVMQGKGHISFDGIDLAREYDHYASHIGYMPQHFGYYPHYTVKEFLEYMSVVKGLTHEFSEKKIKELMKLLNLEDKLNKKMKTLSGGMLRRVGIAQALLNEPDVLILDEPTAGLDPKERMILRNFIATLSQKTIVILSTHIVSDIESIADDIMIMKDGEIIMHDCYDELLKVIEGKVWEVTLSQKEAQDFLENMTIVKSHMHKDEVELRIVSDTKPHALAQNVKPDLDDLYLYYFAEDRDNETVDCK